MFPYQNAKKKSISSQFWRLPFKDWREGLACSYFYNGDKMLKNGIPSIIMWVIRILLLDTTALFCALISLACIYFIWDKMFFEINKDFSGVNWSHGFKYTCATAWKAFVCRLCVYFLRIVEASLFKTVDICHLMRMAEEDFGRQWCINADPLYHLRTEVLFVMWKNMASDQSPR